MATHCYECNGTNLWSLMWVRANPLAIVLEPHYDTEPYTQGMNEYHKCDDCNKQVQVKEIEDA